MDTPPQDGHDVRLSRYVAYVLRHRPDAIGIELDVAGWVPVPRLCQALTAARRHGRVDAARLHAIVESDARRRFEIDGAVTPERIRATYGHSRAVDMEYPEVEPPETLYHGTARRYLGRILADGLMPMGRQFVHLSPTVDTALDVGRRRDRRPVVLEVMARAMAEAGHRFMRTPGGFYLVRAVPPGFLLVAAPEDPDIDS